MPLQTAVHDTWDRVDQAAWDGLVGDRSPFLEHAFLAGLEQTGCACPETGWQPQIITVSDGDAIIAGIPAWRVTHDTGQFVWQGHWKRAADDAGLPLHPKLVVGVPFTPVTGSRLLLRPDRPDATRPALKALSDALSRCHGLHVLFPDAAELDGWTRAGLFLREQFQFHWHNRDYADFEAFLDDFRSKRRKEIRRERREVARLQLDVVERPGPELLDHLWAAYDDTVERNGGTDRFLKRAFFEHLGGAWADRLLAVRARDGGRFVAGALDVVKGDRLYGRYWGQLQDIRFLHFEVCYHQGVAHCIERGLQAFEPGHGGDHKFRRGFLPVRTHSAHLFPHRGVHRSFERAATRETAWFEDKIAELMAESPLRDG